MIRWPHRFALVLALALPATSHAQSAAPASTSPPSATAPSAEPDTTRTQAREHFARGVELIQEARWLDAIAELEIARDLRVTPPVLFNLGLAQRAVGRNREAIRSFRGYLELAGSSRNPDLARQAEGYVRDLGAAIGQLELRIEPAIAVVEIDGHATAIEGRHVEVDPGRHVVTAHADGYANETRSIEVPSGGTAVVVLHLVQSATAAHLHVDANLPTALIRVDDHDVGFGAADENVAPGHHTIEVRASRHATFRREYDAIAGAQTNVRAVLRDQRTVFEHPLFWVVTVVVVAGAAAITGYLLSGPDAPYRGSWGLVTNAITAGDSR